MAKKLKESTKFKLALEKLGYESIGEFVELVGGFAAMVSEGKDVSIMAKPLALHCGQIVVDIDHMDAVAEKNKNLREIDEKIKAEVKAEVKEVTKEKEETVVNPGMILNIEGDLEKLLKQKANQQKANQ